MNESNADDPKRKDPPPERPERGPAQPSARAEPRREPGLTERIKTKLRDLMKDDTDIYPLF